MNTALDKKDLTYYGFSLLSDALWFCREHLTFVEKIIMPVKVEKSSHNNGPWKGKVNHAVYGVIPEDTVCVVCLGGVWPHGIDKPLLSEVLNAEIHRKIRAATHD
jgi:hypothetical protein